MKENKTILHLKQIGLISSDGVLMEAKPEKEDPNINPFSIEVHKKERGKKKTPRFSKEMISFERCHE